MRLLSGFVLPKFTEKHGTPFLEALAEAEAHPATADALAGRPLRHARAGVPELLHLESRADTLAGIARSVAAHRDRVLAVRLGVTDFCSAYGLRRSPDMTAYDVQIVAHVIADVVNVLRARRRHRVHHHRTGLGVLPPPGAHVQAHAAPQRFMEGRADELRTALIQHDLDGLLREIELDRANGLLGKTCIHPSHVQPVHALSVVSHEEYSDARDILRPDRNGGGVMRSAYTNKMNEVKPHRAWAERTLRRAEVFGVAKSDVGFVDLLAAGLAVP